MLANIKEFQRLKIQRNLLNIHTRCFTLTALTCMWKNQNLHPTHPKVSRMLELHPGHCTSPPVLPCQRQGHLPPHSAPGPWEAERECRVGNTGRGRQELPNCLWAFRTQLLAPSLASMPRRQHLSSERSTLPGASKGEESSFKFRHTKSKTSFKNHRVFCHEAAG